MSPQIPDHYRCKLRSPASTLYMSPVVYKLPFSAPDGHVYLEAGKGLLRAIEQIDLDNPEQETLHTVTINSGFNPEVRIFLCQGWLNQLKTLPGPLLRPFRYTLELSAEQVGQCGMVHLLEDPRESHSPYRTRVGDPEEHFHQLVQELENS